MAVVVIPTRNDLLEYRQQVRLEGVLFTLIFHFNSREGFWYVDLLESDDTPIKFGIKLLTGFSRLRLVALASRPPGDIVMIDTTGTDTEAGFDDIGTSVEMLYAEEADVIAATA